MRQSIENRAVRTAKWIIDNNATVRRASAAFSISKSTIFKDMTERLPQIDRALFDEVMLIMQLNKKERTKRGGMARKNRSRRLA